MTFKINSLTHNSFSQSFDDLSAQGVRIYPKKYNGDTPKFSPTFFYN